MSGAPRPDARLERDADERGGAAEGMAHGGGVRGVDDEAKRRAAVEAARAAHAPRSTASGRVALFAYGLIGGSIVAVSVLGYVINGVSGLVFAFALSVGTVVVGGVPVWLASRSQRKEYEAERARAARRAERREREHS